MNLKFRIIILLFFLIIAISPGMYAQTSGKVIPSEYRELANPYAANPKAIKTGYKIYQKACWNCHGDNGDGNGPQSNEIKTKVASFKDPVVKGRTDGELLWWIQTGGNDMESFKKALTEEDIWMVVAYIRKTQSDN